MKQSNAIAILTELSARNRWVFLKCDLEVLFAESGGKLDQTLSRLSKAGILIHAAHGVYVSSLGSYESSDVLGLVARNLRRGKLTYESLESALSRYGIISQIPLDRRTYMTTGRSAEYRTPFGVIEFTHTSLPPERIIPHLLEGEGSVPIATPRFAYENLKSVGRNLDLVNEEEIDVEN